jgi:hypothetical protein
MVDDYLVVCLAWFDVEDPLGERPVTLDGAQPYRERPVRSHDHASDYVPRSGRRLVREGTGNGKGGQNNSPPDHLKSSFGERLPSQHRAATEAPFIGLSCTTPRAIVGPLVFCAARAPSPAEKRQLIDQLYFSMIEIGQHGKQAMKDIDAAMESAATSRQPTQ